MTRMLAVLAVTGLITVACADDTDTGGPAAPPGPGTTADATQPVTTDAHRSDGLVIDVTIEDGSVTPTNERFQGRVGEPITIRVTSDTDDELHVHSIPEHTFAVAPRADQTFEFTVEVPGQVKIELHDLHRTIATVHVRQ